MIAPGACFRSYSLVNKEGESNSFDQDGLKQPLLIWAREVHMYFRKENIQEASS